MRLWTMQGFRRFFGWPALGDKTDPKWVADQQGWITALFSLGCIFGGCSGLHAGAVVRSALPCPALPCPARTDCSVTSFSRDTAHPYPPSNYPTPLLPTHQHTGSLPSGALTDKLGRKKSIILLAAIFTIGAIIQFAPNNYEVRPSVRQSRGACVSACV